MTQVHHVALVNKAPSVPDAEVAIICEVYRRELVRFCRDWSLSVPGLAVYDAGHQGDPKEEAAIYIVEASGDPTAYGRHTMFGRSIWGYVDAGLCRRDGEPLSRVIGHELFELVCDPGLDHWRMQPDGSSVAVEPCDPVERSGYLVEGEFFGHTAMVDVADWCLPAWYVPGAAGPLSHLNTAPAPLVDLPGGFHQTKIAGAVITSGPGARVTSFGRTFRRMAVAQMG